MGAQGYNWATLPLGDINTEAWSSGMGVGRVANNPTLTKRKLLRSLQEIQPDFLEEAKVLAGLWSQGKKKKKKKKKKVSFISLSVSLIFSVTLALCEQMTRILQIGEFSTDLCKWEMEFFVSMWAYRMLVLKIDPLLF
jgi:hypothetical protein